MILRNENSEIYLYVIDVDVYNNNNATLKRYKLDENNMPVFDSDVYAFNMDIDYCSVTNDYIAYIDIDGNIGIIRRSDMSSVEMKDKNGNAVSFNAERLNNDGTNFYTFELKAGGKYTPHKLTVEPDGSVTDVTSSERETSQRLSVYEDANEKITVYSYVDGTYQEIVFTDTAEQ